ncbi:hypothetical protein [Nonomuraea sediminis]|uniref:hypothetical protein n=1 Tax=Nonomuraea sediminis TaxID=2835864 RepID=UPI001BDD4D86|nr:hypothetical protein [Nonomuraea sediminis]
MISIRHRQAIAAAILADLLLTRELPVMDWELSDHPEEPALLAHPGRGLTDEQEVDAVRRWAAALSLPPPTWKPDPPVGGMYGSSGCAQGSTTARVSVFLEEPPSGEAR